jgi:hypothetical protein
MSNHRSIIIAGLLLYPEFSEAMKVGKSLADDRVERSFYQRCDGNLQQRKCAAA